MNNTDIVYIDFPKLRQINNVYKIIFLYITQFFESIKTESFNYTHLKFVYILTFTMLFLSLFLSIFDYEMNFHQNYQDLKKHKKEQTK